MRNDYYNYKWTRPSLPTRNGQADPRGVEPYGPVPPQTGQNQSLPAPAGGNSGGPGHGRTPDAWQRRPKAKSRKRGKTGVPGFLCCFVLLLGLSGLAIYAQGGIQVPGLWWTIQDIWNGDYQWSRWEDSSPWGYNDPWSDDWWYETEGNSWTDRLPNTTVARAPLGDGTTLTLDAKVGETLTPQEIYEKVNPSIVSIRSLISESAMSMGSGVIMSRDGYIITNAHVIAGSRELEVLFTDGRRVNALLVGYDGSTDLAVLKVAARDLPVAEFGDSDSLRVGDPAYAIGNPLGEELRGTMTDGMVSAIDRVVAGDNGSMTLIQTTAALNPGNSGGALVNAAGQVVGITNMKMMAYRDEVYEGLGFAIPTAVAKEVVDQIIAQGHYAGTPMLGITVMTQVAQGETPAGALVYAINTRSDAYRKGLRVGDVITSFNGETITDMDGLLAAKEGLPAGTVVRLGVWSPSKGQRTLRVRIMESWELES